MLRKLMSWNITHNIRNAISKIQRSRPYQYNPLNESNNEIRLMTLLPGDFSTPIRILLETTRFELEHATRATKQPADDQNPELQFEALSYAWGSVENPASIYVGTTGRTKLSVSRNLAVALPYLRYRDKTRKLWIDAICVNQQDLDERSQQVLRMGDIYSCAAKVIIWLGAAGDRSELALSFLKDLSSKVMVNEDLSTMTSAPGFEPHWGDVSVLLPSYDATTQSTLLSLFDRAWFQRLWVMQEVALARSSTTVIMCGFDSISWTEFCRAIYCLFSKWPFPKRPPLQVSSICFMSDAKDKTLRLVIAQSKHSRCFDSRDRLFAVRSLVPAAERAMIVPDYSKEVREIYQDLVMRFILSSETQGLDLLRDCRQPTSLRGCPSWVPDWTTPNPCGRLSLLHASSQSWSEAQFDGNILRTTGVVCATIQTVQHASQYNPPTAWDELKKLVPLDTLTGTYVDGTSTLEALCRVLYVDQLDDRIEGRIEDIENAKAMVRHALDPTLDSSEIPRSFQDLEDLENRCFLTTAEGYFGIASKEARVGDQVCVLLGCGVPLILRPTGHGQYQVIGETFVQGLMYGEALLGRLPSHFHPFWKHFQGSGGRWGFLDSISRDFFFEDPRFGPLPTGWRMEHETLTRSARFLDEEELTVTYNDPRLSPAALKARGVKLETLELI